MLSWAPNSKINAHTIIIDYNKILSLVMIVIIICSDFQQCLLQVLHIN